MKIEVKLFFKQEPLIFEEVNRIYPRHDKGSKHIFWIIEQKDETQIGRKKNTRINDDKMCEVNVLDCALNELHRLREMDKYFTTICILSNHVVYSNIYDYERKKQESPFLYSLRSVNDRDGMNCVFSLEKICIFEKLFLSLHCQKAWLGHQPLEEGT